MGVDKVLVESWVAFETLLTVRAVGCDLQEFDWFNRCQMPSIFKKCQVI